MNSILLVDDEPEILDLLSEHLRMEGFDVNTAESGETALNEMRLRRPDLLLLDVMLPGMDGYELCCEMQADPALDDIPVIMLTAHPYPEELAGEHDVAPEDLIAKPFDVDELLSRIRAQLDAPTESPICSITGLPTGESACREATEAARSADSAMVLHAELQALGAYTEAYSFSEGDRLISLAADALRSAVEHCNDPAAYLAYLGGPRFVAVLSRDVWDSIVQHASQIFSYRLQDHLSRMDRQRGYILALDDNGRLRRSPLPTLVFSGAAS